MKGLFSISLTTGCLLMIAFYFLNLRNYFNVTIIFVLLFPRKNTKPFFPPPLARFLLPYGQLCIFCLLLQAQFCQAQLQFFNFNFKLEAEIALISIYHIQLLPFLNQFLLFLTNYTMYYYGQTPVSSPHF